MSTPRPDGAADAERSADAGSEHFADLGPPDAAPPATRRPWPYSRLPADIEDSQVRLLRAVALALLFEEYDLAMLTSALKHIAADLRLSEASLPNTLGLIRIGALPAFFIIPYADRLGRRAVFLGSLVAMGLATLLTAFSQTALHFVLLQMLTRVFFVTGSAVAFLFITEEFPARHRGLGIGLLGAIGATGHGLGALLFSQIERLPYGWRTLYAVGGLPLLLLPHFRRNIPETRRFLQHRQAAGALGGAGGAWLGWALPLRSLAREHPWRALGVGLTGFLPAFGSIGTFQYTGYFTQKVHGWTPGHYSLMVIAGGAIGIVGNVVAGRLGDRVGRRFVGMTMLGVFPAFVWLFYRGPAPMLPLAWVAFVFASQGGRVVLRGVSTELFPTAYRGAAAGFFSVLDVAGSAAGLFAIGRLVHGQGDYARIIPLVACATILGGVIVLTFPETRNQELEAIH